MTIKEYHAHPALSRSRLWALHDSPEKFKYLEEHPPEITPTLRLGAAFHKYALEPETFDDEYAVSPVFDRRTREGKAGWEVFVHDTMGKTIISQDEFETIFGMRNSLMANPTAKTLVEKSMKEQSFFWTEAETGIELKCRPDILLPELGIIADLKSCVSADTESFSKECLRLGYDVQAAMYTEGVKETHPGEYAFMFIAVEKNPPYSVNVTEMDPAFVDYGRIRYKALLSVYAECARTGNWYGLNGAENVINRLELPKWAE